MGRTKVRTVRRPVRREDDAATAAELWRVALDSTREARDADYSEAPRGVEVWSYRTRETFTSEPIPRTDDGWGYSGTSPAGAGEWTFRLLSTGSAVTERNRSARTWNHHMIGCGGGHDDAQFAETGRSQVAWEESPEGRRFSRRTMPKVLGRRAGLVQLYGNRGWVRVLWREGGLAHVTDGRMSSTVADGDIDWLGW